jgi:hypothetical protein
MKKGVKKAQKNMPSNNINYKVYIIHLPIKRSYSFNLLSRLIICSLYL